MMTFDIPKELSIILEQLPSSYLVGGCVRDYILEIPCKDFDIEVYDIESYDRLVAILSQFGTCDIIGKSFGIIKLFVKHGNDSDKHITFDFSLPRRENKIGVGHKGFSVTFESDILRATERRDLTINSLLYCPRENKVIDFFGGVSDLENGILRHINDESFIEDPLRPLRIFQFAARFNFDIASKTLLLCRDMFSKGAHNQLPNERISEEFLKFILKGKDYFKGIKVLREMGWLSLFPELLAIDGLHQDPEYHPEGDVLTHSLHCLTAMKQIVIDNNIIEENTIITYLLAALCHDLGKATTTIIKNGRIASPNHDVSGEIPTRSLLNRLNINSKIIDRVISLVKNHMAHLSINENTNMSRFVRKLSDRMFPENIVGLSHIVLADYSGRPPLPAKMPAKMNLILEVAKNNNCATNKMLPIINGEHLLKIGFKEGKFLGDTLRMLYKRQLNGEFSCVEDGMKFVKK